MQYVAKNGKQYRVIYVESTVERSETLSIMMQKPRPLKGKELAALKMFVGQTWK